MRITDVVPTPEEEKQQLDEKVRIISPPALHGIHRDHPRYQSTIDELDIIKRYDPVLYYKITTLG